VKGQDCNLIMPHYHENTETLYFHYNLFTDIKILGIYYNSLSEYGKLYPSIEKSHSHDFYTILILTGCNGKINVNNNIFPCRPRSLCLFGPDQIHSISDFQGSEGIVLSFCHDFYVEEFSLIRLLKTFSCTLNPIDKLYNPLIQLSEDEFNTVVSFTSSIKYEYDSSDASDNNSAVIIRSLLNILLLKISDLYFKRSENHNNPDNNLIYKLSRLVDSCFIQQQRTQFYSSECQVSESKMNNICHTYFKCGLKQILQTRLIQEARRLILNTDLTVAEIAYKLNFEDDSYFNKAFKAHTGITPGIFRDIHRKLLP